MLNCTLATRGVTSSCAPRIHWFNLAKSEKETGRKQVLSSTRCIDGTLSGLIEDMKGPQRVQIALRELGVEINVTELDASTRTAQQAADAIGTDLGSIVKSLVFLTDGQPVIALVAGDRRADLSKLEALIGGGPVKIANAIQVREVTGYAIGGVPPVGHKARLSVWIDYSLSRFQTVYAAAGGPRAIFPVAYAELVKLTEGSVADITE